MVLPSWSEFTRIFDNKVDTYWWLGARWHKEHGQVWPYEGVEAPEGYVYPQSQDYLTALICAILLTVLRFSFERLVAEPLGYWLGLRHKLPGTAAGANAKLEGLLGRTRRPNAEQIQIAAQDADMEIRQVEQWIRRKQREMMPSKLNKFKESAWRLLFYTVAFTYGLYTLWQEEYFWNTMKCWVGFPGMTWAIKNSLYYYYLLEGSFYLSLMVSQFIDTKRKDFWEMFIHHIATLALIGGSWFGGCYRMGSIVMVTHDVADVFLEAAKVGVYLKSTWISQICFGGFASSWFIFRLVIFPVRVLYSALVEAHYEIQPSWPVHPIYAVFLIVLQVLHIWWFSFIVKLILRLAFEGAEVDKDTRSDDETPRSSTDEK